MEQREAITVADVEHLVARFTAEALKVPSVPVDANLLELGVDSLVATRIVGRLRTELGIDIPLIALFENPDIPDFAQEIMALHEDAGAY